MNIKKTANLLLNFALKRLAEVFGILISLTGVMLFLALITYSPNDPNFIFPDNTKIENLMGFQGSFVSDLFFQSVGLIAYLIPFTFIFTGISILKTKDFFLFIENNFFTIFSINEKKTKNESKLEILNWEKVLYYMISLWSLKLNMII